MIDLLSVLAYKMQAKREGSKAVRNDKPKTLQPVREFGSRVSGKFFALGMNNRRRAFPPPRGGYPMGVDSKQCTSERWRGALNLASAVTGCQKLGGGCPNKCEKSARQKIWIA